MDEIIKSLSKVKVGYSLVVGVFTGTSKNSGKPYEIFHLITRNNTEKLSFSCENVFNNDPGKFDVNLFDICSFLYCGNGNYKNIAQVIKQDDK